MADHEDGILIQRAKAGDRAAIEALLLRYHGLILGIATKWLQGSDAVPDIVQTVRLKVIKNIARFRGEAKFSSWLYRITENSCKDHLKSPANHTIPLATLEEGEEDEPASDTEQDSLESKYVYSNYPAEERKAERSRMATYVLAQVCKEFGPDKAEVATLHFVEGFTAREIIAKTGMSLGKVNKIIRDFRARCSFVLQARYGIKKRLSPRGKSR